MCFILVRLIFSIVLIWLLASNLVMKWTKKRQPKLPFSLTVVYVQLLE